MKKIAVSVISLLLTSILAFGQNLTADQIAGYLNDYAVSMEVSFEVQSSDPFFGNASLYVDGAGYIVKSDDYTFYCDGKTRWTIDEGSKEVYVENNDMKFDLVGILATSKIKFDSNGWPYEISVPVNEDIVAVIRIRDLKPQEKGTRKCALDVSKLDKSYLVTDLR